MPASKPTTPSEWIAILRSGPPGVKKWNRLTGPQRAKVKLSKADLSGCDLRGIKLAGITANDASFAGVALLQADLTGGAFDGVDFTDAKLNGANLSDSHFCKGRFIHADLTGANLTNISLLGADLTDAILTDAVFSGGWFDHRTKWPAGFLPPGDMTWHGRGTDPRLAGKGKNAVATDINGLMARLHTVIDPARMKRTIDMLKKEKHQLFSEIEPTMIRGIVRSQKTADLVYSCMLNSDGIYTCSTPDVTRCMGLADEPCKHILVLVIGLARAGLFDPAVADKWMLAAKTKGPRWNKTVQNHISDSLLKYKGVQAGEVDWRPTETIPEDFYAM